VCTDWEAAGQCSAPCGGGSQRYGRTCNKYCDGLQMDTVTIKACNLHECTDDCKCTEAEPISQCTQTCGTGTRKTGRNCTEATGQGKTCYELGYTKDWKKLEPGMQLLVGEETCNTQFCPLDCSCSDFSAFGKCSQGCGIGVRTRSRTCTPPMYGGKTCGYMKMYEDDYMLCGWDCPSKFAFRIPDHDSTCWINNIIDKYISNGDCRSKDRLEVTWTADAQLLDTTTLKCLEIDLKTRVVGFANCSERPQNKWDIIPFTQKGLPTHNDNKKQKRAVLGKDGSNSNDINTFRIVSLDSGLCVDWGNGALVATKCNDHSDTQLVEINPTRLTDDISDKINWTVSKKDDMSKVFAESELPENNNNNNSQMNMTVIYIVLGTVIGVVLIVVSILLYVNRGVVIGTFKGNNNNANDDTKELLGTSVTD